MPPAAAKRERRGQASKHRWRSSRSRRQGAERAAMVRRAAAEMAAAGAGMRASWTPETFRTRRTARPKLGYVVVVDVTAVVVVVVVVVVAAASVDAVESRMISPGRDYTPPIFREPNTPPGRRRFIHLDAAQRAKGCLPLHSPQSLTYFALFFFLFCRCFSRLFFRF